MNIDFGRMLKHIGKRCLLARATCCPLIFESPCMQAFSTSHCRMKSPKQKDERQEQIESTVFQYVGKHSKRAPRVYVWGMTTTGALGIKKFLAPVKKQRSFREKQLHPYRLGFMDENGLQAFGVGCGYGFTVYLCNTERGQAVYGTGINTDSQLGYQEYPKNSGRLLDYLIEPAEISLPLLHPTSTKLTQVACGRAHTVITTDKEGVFSLGNNSYGQCGRPVVEDENYRGSQQINRVPMPEPIKQICCGQDHTLFLTESGSVYSCGLGSDGQTGLGSYDCVAEPSLVKGDLEGEKIVNVSSRGDCVLAVSEKGDLFGWGNSEYEQLSYVSDNNSQVCVPRRLPFSHVGKVVKAAAAGCMCAILNDKGEVFVWGFGILGKGPKLETSLKPQLIPPTLFGKNEFSPDSVVTDIDCGLTHFMAITNQGDIYSWGRNRNACLGLSHDKDQFFPFKVLVPAEVTSIGCGVDHTVALCKAFA